MRSTIVEGQDGGNVRTNFSRLRSSSHLKVSKSFADIGPKAKVQRFTDELLWWYYDVEGWAAVIDYLPDIVILIVKMIQSWMWWRCRQRLANWLAHNFGSRSRTPSRPTISQGFAHMKVDLTSAAEMYGTESVENGGDVPWWNFVCLFKLSQRHWAHRDASLPEIDPDFKLVAPDYIQALPQSPGILLLNCASSLFCYSFLASLITLWSSYLAVLYRTSSSFLKTSDISRGWISLFIQGFCLK